MTRGELVQDLRVVLDDRAEPYLWDTAYLIRKLDEATDDACIRGSLMNITRGCTFRFCRQITQNRFNKFVIGRNRHSTSLQNQVDVFRLL